MTYPAQQGQVSVAPGDVNRVCASCGTGAQAGQDGDPRHIVIGGGFTTQTATLANGQQVPVQVPVDLAYHLDCHAALGCDHCKEVLSVHDGSVKGKVDPDVGLPKTHKDHVDIEDGEFEQGENGVLRRVKTKAQARKDNLALHKERGVDHVTADEAHKRAEAHRTGETAQED